MKVLFGFVEDPSGVRRLAKWPYEFAAEIAILTGAALHKAPMQSEVAELRDRRVPLYALSNWSAETFPLSLKRFDFLSWFKGILLSGDVRLLKPDPRIFELFFETHNVDPAHSVYIDDLKPNVDAATALGMHGILFTDPPALRKELQKLGLLELK